MATGAIPKVISSASESSSFPMGEDTCSRRAVIPSKKSNVAPNTIKSRAQLVFTMKSHIAGYASTKQVATCNGVGNVPGYHICHILLYNKV